MDRAQYIADAITETAMKAGLSQSVAVETILRELVNAGHSIADIGYCHHRDGPDEIVCKGVRVLMVTHRYSATSIKITYQLYPDGRPGGWPELDLDSAEANE